ncbi:unnamed protein product [marine sediment metagenome]|uniref:Zinc-finger domain-containing protein n=1 Tax=marine sediment metagenome TaxID=412755 RepID=X1SXH9_9ZZZZ
MNSRTNTYMQITEIITKYLDGELNEDELIRFEAELLINPELNELMDLHKEVDETLKDEESISFSNKFKKAYKKYLQDQED